MPDTCVQDYRHQQRGLDAKLNSPLQSAEKLFLLTSPFIEPSPPRGRGQENQLSPSPQDAPWLQGTPAPTAKVFVCDQHELISRTHLSLSDWKGGPMKILVTDYAWDDLEIEKKILGMVDA